jgi:LuxR family maltose regulon positive regulatory protein
VPTPLLATKLHIPSLRPEIVARPKLIECINNGLARKLTLISAPAGFGKTTLLCAWCEQSPRTVGWVTLDHNENDVTRFWLYLIAALQQIQSAFGENLVSALQTSQQLPLENYVYGFINELARIQEPFVLVLEDYHTIENPIIHNIIATLLLQMPEKMHLVISTRSDPPLPVSNLRARGALNELRSADLRLTLEEAEIFLNEVMDLELPEEDIQLLERSTEGWIVGLQLAALSMQDKLDKRTFITNLAGDNRYIADYLVEEVLQQQSPEVQHFLLHTCLLDYLNSSLCKAVTKREDCYQMLLELERSNLFILPMDDKRVWFRYHNLFADLLRARFYQSQPELMKTLHQRASLWFETHQLPREAINHAFATGDLKRATALIESNAIKLITHGEIETVVKWLDRLPVELREARPWLSIARAWAMVGAGQLSAVEAELLKAESVLGGKPQEQRIVGHVATIRACVAGMGGDQPRAFKFARTAMQNLPETDFNARGMAGILFGLALRWRGDLQPSIQAYSKAEESGRKAGDYFVTIFSLCYQGYALILRGQLRQAHETLIRALDYAEKSTRLGGWQPPIAGLAHAFLSGVLLEWNDLEQALIHAQLGLELSNQWGHAHAILDSYFFIISCLLATGAFNQARKAIYEAKSIAAAVSEMQSMVIADLEIELDIAMGDFGHAYHEIARMGIDAGDDIPFQRLDHYLALAKTLHADNKPESAIPLLERLLKTANEAGAGGRVIEILTLLALAHRQQGETDRTIDLMGQTLYLAEPEGFVHSIIRHGPPLEDVLHTAAARGMSPVYIGKLLAELETKVTSGTRKGFPANATQIEPLSERELQVLRLLVSGQSSTEVARELVIAVGTARTHIKHIYRKLGVHKRLEAIEKATALGLV